jgi:lysophospholipase L1-like esterase
MAERTAGVTGRKRSSTASWARLALYGGGAVTAVGLAAVGIVLGQAEIARRTIPIAEAPPPRADGLYGSGRKGSETQKHALKLVVLGDSSAAGFGVRKARHTPAALIATGLSRRLHRPVHMTNLAVVGATSARMVTQVDEALELDPDIAVILVGANDVTHRSGQEESVRHLADSVRRLRSVGAQVVVGTCPDLGAIQPFRPPLRWIARRWSRQLATAQTVAVVEAGGWTVSLGSMLGPAFAAAPNKMFAHDRFHPSAEGYALAASVLLPTVVAALKAPTAQPSDLSPAPQLGVRSLPQAAVEAARHAGTEVSGVRVAGRERGPAGRWAQLRRRVWEAVRPAEVPSTVDSLERA